MKKLRLDLDALVVESFDTARGAERGGTVRANEQEYCPYCCCCPCCCTCCNTCCATCPATCQNTCDDATCLSCEYTCQNEYTCAYYSCYSCEEPCMTYDQFTCPPYCDQ
ncbi:MAG TPA: hypothetical protein VF746_01430 [Longimicrobium sp.]|jgi:hypothetical protein